jgi:hypothetical protein
MAMTETDCRLHLLRLIDCLTEAVAFADQISPGTGHNAGMWSAAVNEARALLDADLAAIAGAGLGSVWGRRPAPYAAAPWHVERGEIRNELGDVLANVPYTLGDDQDHANGRLIAAAPELANAARALLDRIDHMTTDDFQRGGERREREALRAVLVCILGGED